LSRTLLAFVLAAFFEIAGCFAFWAWIRGGAAPVWAVVGTASLVAFALTLTRVDSLFAGRTYAAYGGIYIAASLLWLWVVEDQRPTKPDVVGAGLAVVGALIIVRFAGSR
jgi:small multidrug resistance family-3 protein